MQLLGTYQSNLSKWYYDELIALANSAISNGDYAGGITFDVNSLDTLVAAGQTFKDLTLPSAGSRALDEDFNYPLALLAARFAATSTEITDFTSQISTLIDVLNKDTNLLEQLINVIKLQVWVNSIPKVFGAKLFSNGFGVGFGNVGYNIPNLDPNNSVIYNYPARLVNYLDLSTQTKSYGLASGVTSNVYSPKDLLWNYDSAGLTEIEYGTDWGELDFLETDVLLTFNAPQLNVLLPIDASSSPFSVVGVSNTKGIPIYIRTMFTARTSSKKITTPNSNVSSTSLASVLPGDQVNINTSVNTSTGTNGSCSIYLRYYDKTDTLVVDSYGQPILTLIQSATSAGVISGLVTVPTLPNISSCQLLLVQNNVTSGAYSLNSTSHINTPIRLTIGYSIDPTSVSVYSNSKYYLINQDFVSNGQGFVTGLNLPDSTDVTVTFVEYYPSYQCSINQTAWSQVIMFDYLRPYPETTTNFQPIPLGVDSNGVRNKLPIIDDSGLGTGLYIYLNNVMIGEYLLQVYQDANPTNPGQNAQLVIDFGQPRFLNVLNLSSYTNFPCTITSIQSQGFASSSLQTLYSGSFPLSRPTSFRFISTLTSKIIINLVQENYAIKQHQIIPDDYTRRQAINDLQSIIPVGAQESNILPQVVFANGYQYEFGIENISAAMEIATLPTVFISGAYTYIGNPNIVTLNADFQDNVSFYLCYNTYDNTGTLTASNLTGIAITPGVSIISPFSGYPITDRIDLFVKIVFRSYKASVKSFALQVG